MPCLLGYPAANHLLLAAQKPQALPYTISLHELVRPAHVRLRRQRRPRSFDRWPPQPDMLLDASSEMHLPATPADPTHQRRRTTTQLSRRATALLAYQKPSPQRRRTIRRDKDVTSPPAGPHNIPTTSFAVASCRNQLQVFLGAVERRNTRSANSVYFLCSKTLTPQHKRPD